MLRVVNVSESFVQAVNFPLSVKIVRRPSAVIVLVRPASAVTVATLNTVVVVNAGRWKCASLASQKYASSVLMED